MKARQRLRRWHIWLGWLVGLPFLAWTLSGLVMAVRPIETVRGEGLIQPLGALPSGIVPVPPAIGPRRVDTLTLEARAEGPRWIVHYSDGGVRLADARTGRLLPGLSAAEAARAVEARYAGKARIAAVDRTRADAPPIELRRPIQAWRVTMSDGTRIYLDAATGERLATRTRWWRFYDLMWGIHIMDPFGRENANNVFEVGFAALALLTTALALVLLPLTLTRRRRSGARPG